MGEPIPGVSKVNWTAIFALVVVAAGAAVTGAVLAQPDPQPRAEPTPQPEATVPTQPSTVELIMAETSLPKAIRHALPLMRDTSGSVLNVGGELLSEWSTTRLRWAELEALPSTSWALVMKDPNIERGKRHCITGRLVQIHASKKRSAYWGTIADSQARVTSFEAHGSTGDLVAGSSGKFCGVACGIEEFENTGGGTTQAVFAVGMFDLPANRPKTGR